MWRENIIIAFRSLLGNKLRSSLTITIIALGITALVGIQTSIEVMTSIITSFYENIGIKSFTISENTTIDDKLKNQSTLTYSEVKEFIEQYNIPSKKCIFTNISNNETIHFKSTSSDPIVKIIAIEGDYLEFATLKILKGRYFTQMEISTGQNVCILGESLANSIFGSLDPINQTITTSNKSFKIIGILESVGTLFKNNSDWSLLLPISTAQQGIITPKTSFTIGVIPIEEKIEKAINEAGVLFRGCRRLRSYDITDFKIETTDAIERQFSDIKKTLSSFALIIGLITIFGSAIGLMNIMLVTVRERSREIGIRKTLGATKQSIKFQFITESIILGQIGDCIGILLGITLGNFLSFLLDTEIIIPWNWIFLSILLCSIVSILSGYIPAKRASQLDPIEALRNE